MLTRLAGSSAEVVPALQCTHAYNHPSSYPCLSAPRPFPAVQDALESAGSSGSSPFEGSSASCLDQYAPMLPSDPIAQLPLLPTTARTSATERVAAWLLDHTHSEPAAVVAAADSRRNDLAGSAGEHPPGSVAAVDDGCCGASSVACEGEEEDAEELLASLAAEAAEHAAQQAAAHAQAARAAAHASASTGCWLTVDHRCEADHRRSSLERFMKQPVQVRVAHRGRGLLLARQRGLCVSTWTAPCGEPLGRRRATELLPLPKSPGQCGLHMLPLVTHGPQKRGTSASCLSAPGCAMVPAGAIPHEASFAPPLLVLPAGRRRVEQLRGRTVLRDRPAGGAHRETARHRYCDPHPSPNSSASKPAEQRHICAATLKLCACAPELRDPAAPRTAPFSSFRLCGRGSRAADRAAHD